MFTTVSDRAQPTSDLAARLTDLALEIVAGAGTRGDSVETELKLWHALRAELDREFRWRHFTRRYGEDAPLDSALQQVVRRAALRVAGERHSFPEYQARRAERATAHLCQV